MRRRNRAAAIGLAACCICVFGGVAFLGWMKREEVKDAYAVRLRLRSPIEFVPAYVPGVPGSESLDLEGGSRDFLADGTTRETASPLLGPVEGTGGSRAPGLPSDAAAQPAPALLAR